MLRRKPTRLELKMDDIEEFESVKKELENRKRQREEEESAAAGEGPGGAGGRACASTAGAAGPSAMADGRTQAEIVQERIGYKPHPKPATLPALFGNLQF